MLSIRFELNMRDDSMRYSQRDGSFRYAHFRILV